MTSGPPDGTLFVYTLGMAGGPTTVWSSSPELALAAPPGTCVQSFRLEVDPFAFVESSPGFWITDPWPLPATLTAFGTPLDPGADSDGDTLTDAEEELVYGTNPCARDTDYDWLPDHAELFSGPFGTDPLDPDSDDDGFEDGIDNCPAAFYEETGQSGYNPDQANADGDFRGDACDTDDDNDGVLDVDDSCPTVPHMGFDADGDGCRDSLPGFIDSVQALVAHRGAANSLERKAADAHHLLCDVGNEGAALRKFSEIESFLAAQAGKHVPEEVADVLQAYIENLYALRLGPATADICI